MANVNLQNFVFSALAISMGYVAQRATDPKSASWVNSRNQIFAAGLAAAAQELQDQAAKFGQQPAPAQPGPQQPTTNQ